MKLNRRIGTWVSWLAVLSLAVVFAGCSQQTSSSKKSSKAQKIVLYSNSLSAGRGEWLKKEAAKAGFTITPVSMGGGEVINRIISEKNKPVADVVYGSSQFGLAKLEQKGLLKKFSVDWEKDLPKSDVQGNGYYYPLTKQIIVQIADSKTPKSDLPSAWLDLTASPAKYKDMVPNKTGINGQTNQMVIATLLNKYKDTSASDGVSPEAWPAIKNYFKNGKQLGNPELFSHPIAAKKATVSYDFSSDLLGIKKVSNFDPQIINSTDGNPQVTEQVGVVKKSGDTKNAERFAQWLGSAATQKKLAKQFNTWPVNKQAASAINPKEKALLEDIKTINIDKQWFNKNINKWIQKISLNYFD